MTLRISIILPVYNRSELIIETIKSVQAQTFSDWELIVLDDGSTDGTARNVQSMAAKDQRIRYFFQNNAGPSAARNAAIQMATGEWLSFLDSDDLWMPYKLEREMAVAGVEPGVDFIYSSGVIVREDGAIDRSLTDQLRPTKLYTAEPLLFERPRFFTSGVSFRKRCTEKSGLFDVSLRFYEDVDLWFRVLLFFKAYFLDVELVRKRQHSANLGAASPNLALELFSSVLKFRLRATELYQKEVRKLTTKEFNSAVDEYRILFIKEALASGQSKDARNQASIHCKYHPVSGAAYYLLSLVPARGMSWLMQQRRKKLIAMPPSSF